MSADYEAQGRASARASLERMADRDVHLFAGFVASWLVRNLTLNQLADLVVQLDAAFPEQWTDTGSGPGYDEGEQR